jgi:hypothetical protein
VGWEGSVTKADAVTLDAKKKSAGLVVGIRAPIDDDTVARMKWGENFIQLEPVRTSAGDLARKRPTFLSEASVDELLMIDPVEPSRKKAATEGHL